MKFIREDTMSGKVISIQIGLTTTHICEVNYKKKNPRVYKCVSFDTPENSFDDGYIRDKNTFANAAREILTKSKIKGDRVFFTISSSKIVNREVIIPFVKKHRIQDVINANGSEYFPVDISDYILTYTILETIQEDDVKKLRLLVFAAPDNLIKNYYNVAELLGLEVMSIDCSDNSTFQLFKSQGLKGIHLLLQFNEQSTLVNIIENGVLKLQRTVGFSSLSIVHSLMQADYLDISDVSDGLKELVQEKFLLSSEQLAMEEAAATISFVEQENFVQYRKNHELKKEILQSLQYLTGNIQRVLDYYYSKNKDKSVSGIYITGFGSKFNGIEELLHKETGLEVVKFQNLKNVTFSKKVILEEEIRNDYLVCIGATLDPIDYMSKEYQLNEKKSNNKLFIKTTIGTVLILSGTMIATSFLAYKNAAIDQERLNIEVANLSDINEVYEAHAHAKVLFEQVNTMDLMTHSPGTILGNIILELEDKLPTQSIFESFQITESGVTLSVKCNTKKGAAKTLMQLKEISYLTNITTTAITQETDENGLTTTRFIVTGGYNLITLGEGESESDE